MNCFRAHANKCFTSFHLEEKQDSTGIRQKDAQIIDQTTYLPSVRLNEEISIVALKHLSLVYSIYFDHMQDELL
jgi:hypothetical protein